MTANASATPTIVEDRSETGSVNEQFHHRYFPGAEEQKKDPYLVEFDPDDPLNPMVRWNPLCGMSSRLKLSRIGVVRIDGTSRPLAES